MKREWKPVKDYENYMISNFGEVKSLNYNHTGREKLLSQGKDGKGYLKVTLCKNGIKKPFSVHRLVYETLVGEIPEGMQCNHIDEDKENNRVDNLNLMTPKENINWGTHNARMAAARSKLVEAVDKVSGRVVYVFSSIAEAHGQGFNRGAVVACCRNCFSRPGNNVYKGFIWQYKENAQA